MNHETLAVWVQAVATVVLVGVTIKYVHLTGRLAREAESRVLAERVERQRIARIALKHELLDIAHTCPRRDVHPEPALITTHAWDTLKGDLGDMPLSIVADLAVMYSYIRRANSIYEKYLLTEPPPPGTRIIPSQEERWAQLLGTVPDTVRRVSDYLNKVAPDAPA